jgi:exo-1,4-beta-D-glucosaminidase
MLMTSPPVQPAGSPILVPQAQDSELAVPKPPASSVSSLPELQPTSSETSTPPPTTSSQPPSPAPPARTAPKPSPGVDFQAEDALIRGGNVESNHPGFTGRGFVDTDNVVGSSVQWSVNVSRTGSADVVFRFANGGDTVRPMDITLNGILVGTINFPATGSFDNYRTVTVPINLLAGTNKIKATSTTDNGGPNLDKITVI